MTTIDGSKSGGGFETFGEDAQWFRDKLAEEGVRLRTNSPMDNALKAMAKIAGAVNTGAEPVLKDRNALLQLLTDGVGARNLVKVIRDAVATKPKIFEGKWHLFRGPDALLARYRGQTPERNLTWELYVAARCLVGTTDVSIAKGNENPDVRCNLDEDAWGFECKVLDSKNPEKQMERVKEAARQLQGTDIARGVIAVNLTSVIDHSRFAESIRRIEENTLDKEAIAQELARQLTALIRPYTSAGFSEWMHERRKPRAILFHADAIALADKTIVRLTTETWFDLHKPKMNPLIVPFRWPEAADRKMYHVFGADSKPTLFVWRDGKWATV